MKQIPLTGLVALLLVCLLQTPANSQRATYPPAFEGASVQTYKQVGEVELKLWMFQPPDHQPSDSRAAIVFFFGGGWRSGNPAQFEPHCRHLAKAGMLAITADYRVRSRHQTPAVRCVEDGKSAVRWIRSNAKRLGIDPNRIVAGGGSAGGHVAACTALIPGHDDPSDDTTISCVPNALALFNPAVLLAPIDGVEFDAQRLSQLTRRMGVEPREISPIHHVRAGLPPTIIFHGEADTTVPHATVARYTQIAKTHRNRCELKSYPGAQHGFFNWRRGDAPDSYYQQTVQQLDEFLRSLGYTDQAGE